MIVLGIETSSAVCSVGLSRLSSTSIGEQVNKSDMCIERSLIESHIHSEKLLSLIREVCEDQKLALSQIDGVAISIGPGSFTGLRIGLSTAKGLCYSLGKPLLAVSTFEAIANSLCMSNQACEHVVICIDAKQGEYYIGVYEKKDGALHEVFPVQIGNLSLAFAAIHKDTIIVTDRTDEVKKVFSISAKIENIFTYCRGDVVAGIGIEKLKIGKKNDLGNLEPMYLKDFVVRTKMK